MDPAPAIGSELSALLRGFGGRLPPDRVENSLAATDAGEVAMAVEDVCSNLYEFGVVLTADEDRRLRSIVRRLRMDERDLLEHVAVGTERQTGEHEDRI